MDSLNLSNHISSFSVSPNAVLLNSATPTAIAEAAYYLIRNPEVRNRIGQAGRATVASLFTVEKQMEQYSRLYEYCVQQPLGLQPAR